MRVNNFLKLSGILVAMLFLQMIAVNEAAAGNVSFGQKILPVKFVYVTKTGTIESIWSNVSNRDDIYAIKFFDAEKKQEIVNDQKTLDMFLQNGEKDQISFLFTKKTQFIQRGDLFLEEITTVV